LLIDSGNGPTVAKPLDGRTFLVDAADPDTPAVTFGAPDASGRPRVLYDMLWGSPARISSPAELRMLAEHELCHALRLVDLNVVPGSA
jgi:hypothetical protein